MGIYETPYEDFGRLSYEMWRACRLVIDTGVHTTKGWTREQALALPARPHRVERATRSPPRSTATFSWPGQALSYKLGELTIGPPARQRREGAGIEVATSRAFHDTLLRQGSVPLPVLEQQVRAFICERRRGTRRLKPGRATQGRAVPVLSADGSAGRGGKRHALRMMTRHWSGRRSASQHARSSRVGTRQ
jgi:hypothetical protein